MTVKLTGNFLATARCLIFNDGNGIAWSFDPTMNTLEADYSGAGSDGSANPSATIGLAPVDGSADTWMTSDSAPALSQAIAPTWTQLHTFSAGLTVSAGTTTISGYALTLSANATVGGTNTGDQTLPAGANPSATIGLSANNGSAATFMRSDGTPALGVAIAPTWTGQHTFAAASGVPVVSTPVAGTFGLEINSTGSTALSGLYLAQGAAGILCEIGLDAGQALYSGSANSDLVFRSLSGSVWFVVGSTVEAAKIASTGAWTFPVGVAITTAAQIGAAAADTVGFYGKTPAAQTSSNTRMLTSLLVTATTSASFGTAQAAAINALTVALQEVINVLYAIGIYAAH